MLAESLENGPPSVPESAGPAGGGARPANAGERTEVRPGGRPESNLPVIAGAGLSGLVTSLMLSRAGMRHVLVGAGPNTLPRLGESLNLEGSVSLLEMFPEFSRYYLTKRLVVGFLGDHALTCDFCLDNRPIARNFMRAIGYEAPAGFLHLERIGLDGALFEAAVAQETCHFVQGTIRDVDYDGASDRIRGLSLESGEDLEPSYVFDGTNQGRVIARAAGLECRALSSLHRVVYTHYHAEDRGRKQEGWEHATYVVRLYEPVDGIDAMAWCIPLGAYISIGVSCNPERFTGSDEALLELVEQAYARRGLPYRRGFPIPSRVMTLRHRYFAHDRAYGANWLLSGPAYCQVWWMSGSGVGTALASAQVAADAVKAPLAVGRAYDNYLQELLGIHETFDWFARTDPATFTPANLTHQSDLFVRTNVRRLAKATLIRRHKVGAILGGLFYRLKGDSLIHGYCDVQRCELSEQTRFVLNQAAGTADRAKELDHGRTGHSDALAVDGNPGR